MSNNRGKSKDNRMSLKSLDPLIEKRVSSKLKANKKGWIK